jgi:hypothetical protein
LEELRVIGHVSLRLGEHHLGLLEPAEVGECLAQHQTGARRRLLRQDGAGQSFDASTVVRIAGGSGDR